ncbi:tetratricopeptide repeat protein [Mucilaginibacter sp. L3T2-6]|uniref:tetratricopeptide repeat protein n=1 Tax=Mucilaginibacter sp. L3T2-6 TaxID=3062491 RepID=UPI00267550B0|nr:tetratricopeptide repeat protein [Mucilaginibacter sp. L3T2-6]MDO3642389.1 tetratricopeptide repeat protein [Mucilaginibacter sp. L3T2-6]MDV6214884.1 tetratricopeptide repeat protein [Mucilaginibacter sp. L3T2-6]
MRRIFSITALLALLGVTNSVCGQAVARFSPKTDSASRVRSMMKLAQNSVDYYTHTFTLKGLKPEARERMHLERCQAYLILNKFDKAIDDCTAAIAINPKSTKAYITRASIYDGINKSELAIEDCKKAISYSSTDEIKAGLYNLMARSYLQLHQYSKAITADSTAILLNPNLANAYINRAEAFGRLGKCQLAINDLSIALAGYRDKPLTLSDLLAYRGDMKRGLKQYKEAINDYSLSLKLNPDNGMAYWNRAAAYRQNGDYQLAYEGYSKAIAYYKNDRKQLARLYDDRALMEIGLQQFPQAIADDSLALALDTAFAEAYYNIANARAQNGEYARSNTDFKTAINYYSKNPFAMTAIYGSMGHNEYFMGNYQAAVDYSTKAIELHTANSSPYFERARAYLKLKNNDLAINDFKEVLARDTSKQSNNYAFSLFYTGDPNKAIEIMQASFLRTTDSFILMGNYYNMACLYSLMNKPEEANIFLKKCIAEGYNKKYALNDADFDNIRNTAEFKQIIGIK